MVREEPTEPFSHEVIAVRTGISARTVYRHFPTRAALVGALWERMRDETGTSWPKTEADILPAVRAQFARFEAHASFARAAIVASASADYPTYGSAEGRAAFRQSLATVLRDLPPEEGDRLVALCVAIYSAPFWQMLRDRGQLAAEDAAEAAARALEAVIGAARELAARHLQHEARP